MLSMIETVLATANRAHGFGFFRVFGIVKLVLGIAVAVVLIWLLLKVIKLVEAYTKKLK